MLLSINPNDFFSIIHWGMSAYDGLGVWKYPLIIVGVFGYIYMATKSATVTVVGILVTVGLFGASSQIFADVPQLTQFLSIITLIGLVLLFFALIMKLEGKWS